MEMIKFELNTLPIDELGKGALGQWSQEEPWAEHAGIHGNHGIVSLTELVEILPHTYRHKWKGGGEGVKALNRHEWHSRQTACSHTAGKQNT